MAEPEQIYSPLFWGDDKVVTPSYTLDPNKFSTTNMTYHSYSGTDITALLNFPGSGTPPIILGELQTISYSIHRENSPVRTLGHVNPRGFVRGPRTIAGSLIFTQFNEYAFYRYQEYASLINRNNVYPLGDMLPPFDIVLSFVNESGSFSKMKIFGVTLIDEGGTMSVDDLITEQSFTYIARGIQPMVSYQPTPLPNSATNIAIMKYLN